MLEICLILVKNHMKTITSIKPYDRWSKVQVTINKPSYGFDGFFPMLLRIVSQDLPRGVKAKSMLKTI